MTFPRIAALFIGLAPLAAHAQPAGTLAITDAMIFDAAGTPPYRGTLVIREGRIAEVGPDVRAPRGARIIRARGQALLPGFIDVHTHWSATGEPGPLPQVASRYVESGVTTVNDFHQQPEAFAPRRAWLTTVVAPHVNFVARMSTPGGHGADWGDENTTVRIANAEAATRAVTALQAYKPDHIKLFADGWRYEMDPDNSSMNLSTMAAAVEVAHAHGQRVLTHTVTVDRGRLAALSGADVIAHSLQDRPIDPETVAILRTSGIFYAPTLAIYEPVKPADTKAPDMEDPIVRQRFRKYGFAEYNLKTLHEAGVPVALGTDAGISGAPHGSSTLHEMELMVRAGLSPSAALLAGTATAAAALGLAEDRGTLAPGKRADLVLIDGRPWQAIGDVRRISHVVIDGRLALGPDTPLPAANRATAVPPRPVAALVDDFERPDGRTSLDTLRITDMENGNDRSLVLPQVVARPDGGHSLLIAARMALRPGALARVILPFSRGSVQPVDARAFLGVRFALRGSGPYVVRLATLTNVWTATIEGGTDWRTLDLPFSAFRPLTAADGKTPSWQGDDLVHLGFEVARPAGTTAWAELDEISFY
ncbi:amidohydrolase family protein [Polymorphobacter sp.]|uniref:amidohydrolase family protein n=1 Tax=Polymorphobacter sp. TaxID=1909290 RepID=UPI003F72AABE